MTRIFMLLACLPICGILCFWQFAHSNAPKADITYVLQDSIKTLDPTKQVWVEEHMVSLGIWECLAAIDPKTLTPITGVAHIPPQISDDGLTYTFNLNPNAKWSNGDLVTAHHFVYGWRRGIEPGCAGQYSFFLTENILGAKTYYKWRNDAVSLLTILNKLAKQASVSEEDFQKILNRFNLSATSTPNAFASAAETFRNNHLSQVTDGFEKVGIKAINNNTLQITLLKPTGYFVDLVSCSTYAPIHSESIELLREKDHPNTLWIYDTQWVMPNYHKNGYPGLITNGPYHLKKWQFKRYMYFERNEHYWDLKNVPGKSIMAKIINAPSTAFLAYEQGSIDFMGKLERLEYAAAIVAAKKNNERNDIQTTAAFGTYYYTFNCNKHFNDGRPNPFHDKHVRKAFSLAIDQASIVNNVNKTGTPVAYNLIPVGAIAGYNCDPGPGTDIPMAQKLLAEAGFPNGTGLPAIDMLFNTGSIHGTIAQVVQEMWRKNLGVKVPLIEKEIKSMDEDRKSQNFAILRSAWIGDYSDPTTFLDMFITDNGNNKGKYTSAYYDGLLTQAGVTMDPTARMKILSEAETYLLNECAILPLFYYVNIDATHDHVKGIFPNARNLHPFKSFENTNNTH